MSYKLITERIIDNFICEFEKPENMRKIKSKVIEPLIVDVISEMYPYILFFIICISLLFLLIMISLMLNIKVYYKGEGTSQKYFV
jgi:hypothetical protein